MKNGFLQIRNASPYRTDSVPLLEMAKWREAVIDACKNFDGRLVAMFGNKEQSGACKLFAVIALDSKGGLYISSTVLKEKEYKALTPELTQAHLFERELCEEFGIIPKDHPRLKPIRKIFDYPFYSATGRYVHEVAVGPVHAGVIEPGHFRFQCNGEKVFNLEIALGYQRRGVEELMSGSKPSKRLALAESIAGDSSVSHALAYCHAVEGLASDRQVTQRAKIIRAFALEMERVANHIGDLGALANDVGFLPPASFFGRLKADFLNILLALNGNRFGRSLLRPGGVAFDIGEKLADGFKRTIERGMKEAGEISDLLLNSPSVLARFEHTGVVKTETAKELGLVGVTARASGLQRDVRCDHPYGMYRFKKMIPVKAVTGDVFARARIRSLEIKRSLEFALEILADPPREKTFFPCTELQADSFVVSLVEGWRGEIVHIAFTNEASDIIRYKIIDPSFHNWPALEMALRGGAISDFPLCNKSFNLSYAGHDL